MALGDRIVRKDDTTQAADIAPIVFYSAFLLWVRGDVAASALQSRFNLDSQEINQAQALKTTYDGLSTAVEKALYLQRMHAAMISYENLVIDKATLISILGL